MKKIRIVRKTKEKAKNKRGITLIALVITIIVLLILAGVTIATLSGPNGILNNATLAKGKTKIATIKEQAEIAKQGIIIENQKQGIDTTRDEIINAIAKELQIPTEDVEGNLIKTENGEYEIMVKEDNTIEVVSKGEGYVDAEYKQPAPESDFLWKELEDGTIRILEYIGNEISLNIPETIDGKKVTVIQNDEMIMGGTEPIEGGEVVRNKAIKSLKLPDTVTIIGYASFRGNQIEELKLSKELLRIEDYAFCSNRITSIEISEKVVFIGERAFFDNQATKIEIPKSVVEIEGGAFTKNNLEKIIYGRTEMGEEDRTIINSYAGRKAGDIIILKGVKEIQNSAFFSVGVTSIEIPEGVEKIGGMCFSSSENCKKIIIPTTINYFGAIAFNFKNIEYIEFKRNVFVEDGWGIITANKINKIKVPYSEDGSILEYYQELINKGIIFASGGIDSIVDQ